MEKVLHLRHESEMKRKEIKSREEKGSENENKRKRGRNLSQVERVGGNVRVIVKKIY